MRPPESLVPGARSGLGVRRAARQPWRAAAPARRRCAPASPPARPGPPGLREPSPRPAPALTAHARPPPSPGAGAPAAAACPRGRARRGDRRPGSGRAHGAVEDKAGGRRRASYPAACDTPGAQGKFGGARGGAEGARPRPAPPCPRVSERSHGRAPSTGEARICAPGRSFGC